MERDQACRSLLAVAERVTLAERDRPGFIDPAGCASPGEDMRSFVGSEADFPELLGSGGDS
jgi:hypothetical protein